MPFYNIFGNDWIGFAFYFVAILGFVVVSGLLLEKFKVSGESTRQFVHVGVGLLVITSPFTIESSLQPALLAAVFVVLNLINVLKGGMKGIHSTERLSFGTVFFPCTFLILILLYWDRPYILITGMAIMTLSDPLASIIGAKFSWGRFFTPWKDEKSLYGSVSVCISSSLIVFLITVWINKLLPGVELSLVHIVVMSVIVGIVAALSESISFAGSDNLSLPLFSALVYDVCLSVSMEGLLAILGWILFSLFLAVISYKLKALDLSGAFGAMLLGSIVFSIGGVYWALPMVTFYVLSSVLSKIGGSRKHTVKGVIEKGSRRDIYQVFANGGVAFLSAILYWYTRNNVFYIAFLGSLAAATADTWGTEIGILSKSSPVSVVSFRHVPIGTSGGVTFVGTVGTITGALILALSGLPGIAGGLVVALAVTIGGILGALTDSIVGATVQAQYRCPECGKITEKKLHCMGVKTEHISGVRWVNNDLVNLICTLSGGVYSVILYQCFA